MLQIVLIGRLRQLRAIRKDDLMNFQPRLSVPALNPPSGTPGTIKSQHFSQPQWINAEVTYQPQRLASELSLLTNRQLAQWRPDMSAARKPQPPTQFLPPHETGRSHYPNPGRLAQP